jgi:hypothetical protein
VNGKGWKERSRIFREREKENDRRERRRESEEMQRKKKDKAGNHEEIDIQKEIRRAKIINHF